MLSSHAHTNVRLQMSRISCGHRPHVETYYHRDRWQRVLHSPQEYLLYLVPLRLQPQQQQSQHREYLLARSGEHERFRRLSTRRHVFLKPHLPSCALCRSKRLIFSLLLCLCWRRGPSLSFRAQIWQAVAHQRGMSGIFDAVRTSSISNDRFGRERANTRRSGSFHRRRYLCFRLQR